MHFIERKDVDINQEFGGTISWYRYICAMCIILQGDNISGVTKIVFLIESVDDEKQLKHTKHFGVSEPGSAGKHIKFEMAKPMDCQNVTNLIFSLFGYKTDNQIKLSN